MSRRAIAVMTHGRPQQVEATIARLLEAARASDVELRLDALETAKHGLAPEREDCIVVDESLADDVELCIVLGGDGTILQGLRACAGTAVPVFAVNFGEVGFLATIEPDELDEFSFERAFAGEFEVLSLPAIAFSSGSGVTHEAFNDISFHRKVGGRVARRLVPVGGERQWLRAEQWHDGLLRYRWPGCSWLS